MRWLASSGIDQPSHKCHKRLCLLLLCLLSCTAAGSSNNPAVAEALKQADAARQAGDLKQAVKVVRKAERQLRKSRGADELSVRLMELYLDQTDYDRAYKQLKRFEKRFSASPLLEVARETMCQRLAARPIIVRTQNIVHVQPVHYLSRSPEPRSNINVIAKARSFAPGDKTLAAEPADTQTLFDKFKVTDTAKLYHRLGQSQWRRDRFAQAAEIVVEKGPVESRVQETSRHRMVGSVTRYRHAHEVAFRRTEKLRLSISDFSECRALPEARTSS